MSIQHEERNFPSNMFTTQNYDEKSLKKSFLTLMAHSRGWTGSLIGICKRQYAFWRESSSFFVNGVAAWCIPMSRVLRVKWRLLVSGNIYCEMYVSIFFSAGLVQPYNIWDIQESRKDQKPTSCPNNWTCGAMDNASDYGSEDSRFESWQVRCLFRFHNHTKLVKNAWFVAACRSWRKYIPTCQKIYIYISASFFYLNFLALN